MSVFKKLLRPLQLDEHGQPKREATYTAKFRFQGKQYVIATKLTDKEEAQRVERNTVKALNAGRFEVLDAMRLRDTHSVTLRDIIEIYKARATCADRTRRANIGAIRLIIRRAEVHAKKTDPEIDALPVSILTAELLSDYQQAVLRAAGEDKLKQGSAAVSANSMRRQARSLFSADMLEYYAHLKLPAELTRFLRVKNLPEPDLRFRMLPAELIAAIRSGAVALRAADPNAYRIYLLAMGCGLRKKEIASAQFNWLEDAGAGRWQIHIQTTADFKPKDTSDRIIPMEAMVRDELVTLRVPALPGQPEYILTGHKTERTDAAFDRFSAWLVSLGWTRKKKAHELRKLFGSLVADQAGLSAAQDLLGHSSPEITKAHYVGQVRLPDINVFRVA